ncbi:MAG TPA: EF-hand domain-containing protein [Bryobacteraceae bacterium]|jgi:Ca2+-binding EF-hand superfamily protein|nr:EF-hand domain-containing protein [Bryobacteraceae bacterium]
MTRWCYILLLRLHPGAFRQRFGDEMLAIFDQSARKTALMADGFVSLFRQRALRRSEVVFSSTATADGVPLFYSAAPEVPRAGAFFLGMLISFLAFGLIAFTMSHRWRQMNLIVGSHHPSPSHLLGAHTDAQPVADLPAEVKLNPYPFHPPISAYFRLILVLAALDADQDNEISAAEMENAPAALWKLDKNHDGKLTAEECGLKPDDILDPMMLGRMRLAFMRVHPVLAALDTNGDGEISASEIRNAAAALRALDSNDDGKLVENELRPEGAVLEASSIMFTLDRNGDGRISRDEMQGAIAARLRGLLSRADRTSKGYVTEGDLLSEIRLSEGNR